MMIGYRDGIMMGMAWNGTALRRTLLAWEPGLGHDTTASLHFFFCYIPFGGRDLDIEGMQMPADKH
jgi:hypothetical protein